MFPLHDQGLHKRQAEQFEQAREIFELPFGVSIEHHYYIIQENYAYDSIDLI